MDAFSELSTDERLREIAAILALGLRHLCDRHALLLEHLSDSSPNRLEAVSPILLTDHAG